MAENGVGTDIIQLGGNIELSGFREIEKINNVVINKIVGNYARKFSEIGSNFEKLQLHLKTVHASEDGNSKKIELHARVFNNGKVFASEVVDRNLYFALDAVLKKVKAEMEKSNARY